MKSKFLFLFAIVSSVIYAQDTIQAPIVLPVATHAQIFALSPISKKIDKVNGLAFGLGHVANKRIANQTINGLNLEANPAPAAGALMAFMAIVYLPEIIRNNKTSDSIKQTEDYFKIKNLDHTPHLRINGVNLSTGCFFTTTSMNGLNISLGNKFNDFNGLSLAPLGTISDKQIGISIGICNANNRLIGSTIGLYNQSYELRGVHIGILNHARNNHGVQVGVFNKSNSKGLQLGLWNVNNKRSMPFINW